MSIETELKLGIQPSDLQRLKRHPFLRSLSSGRAQVKKLYSIYYDTQDLALQRHACALRLRRVGKQWLQTLKGGGQVSAGLHQRNEWEMPVVAQRLDLAALEAAGGRLPPGVHHHLQPVFVTAFTRSVRLLSFEGAQIELCLDSGEVSAGKGVHPISELELELISGPAQSLFKLALHLMDIVPLRVEHTSKAEYGYRLCSAAAPVPSKARLPRLSVRQDAASAMLENIAACLTHIQDNVPGALLGHDAEYLHQVRVGLRRLRVALMLASRLHADDAELADLSRQVSALCVMLGQARDWDVLVTRTLPRLPADEVGNLLQAAQHVRREQQAQAVAQLAAADFQRLLLRLGCWMQGNMWPVGIGVEAFARNLLDKRRRRLKMAGAVLHGDDAASLHALRIACKKMRYMLELFGGLLPDCAESLQALIRLQELLGEMNDLSVARQLLERLDNRARHATLARIHEWIVHDHAQLAKGVDQAWQRYAAQKKCW
ncbi:MAG: CHAD domain-containing protein [Pseudomonadota bacterium]